MRLLKIFFPTTLSSTILHLENLIRICLQPEDQFVHFPDIYRLTSPDITDQSV